MWAGILAIIEVRQDALDHRWLFDAHNHIHLSATGFASLNVDFEHALQALRPCHRRVAIDRGLFRAHRGTRPRRTGVTMFAQMMIRRASQPRGLRCSASLYRSRLILALRGRRSGLLLPRAPRVNRGKSPKRTFLRPNLEAVEGRYRPVAIRMQRGGLQNGASERSEPVDTFTRLSNVLASAANY